MSASSPSKSNLCKSLLASSPSKPNQANRHRHPLSLPEPLFLSSRQHHYASLLGVVRRSVSSCVVLHLGFKTFRAPPPSARRFGYIRFKVESFFVLFQYICVCFVFLG
ncbi:hypothetical protein LWI28_004276 [Acer negundo]|uniref:Uncharacterized protein n=1 Tax=Acer negundo TaxID=4023 RepID=A0AAD5IYX9_ACENE|nr:hypothetical protein LWI28_004276 [Acer negundo]